MSGDFAAAFLPTIFVPLVGLGLPAVLMSLIFTYIESEA